MQRGTHSPVTERPHPPSWPFSAVWQTQHPAHFYRRLLSLTRTTGVTLITFGSTAKKSKYKHPRLNLTASACWQLCLTHYPLPAAPLQHGRAFLRGYPAGIGMQLPLPGAKTMVPPGHLRQLPVPLGSAPQTAPGHAGISTRTAPGLAGSAPRTAPVPPGSAPRTAPGPARRRRRPRSLPPQCGGAGRGPGRPHGHTHTRTHTLIHTLPVSLFQGTITAITPYPAVAAGIRAKRRKAAAICPAGRLANCS